MIKSKQLLRKLGATRIFRLKTSKMGFKISHPKWFKYKTQSSSGRGKQQGRPRRPGPRFPNGHRKFFKRRRNFLYGETEKQRFGVVNQYTMVKRALGRRSIDECGRINYPGMTGLSAKQHRVNSKLVKRARSTNQLLPYSVRIRSGYRTYRFVRKGLGKGFKPFLRYRLRRERKVRSKIRRRKRYELRRHIARQRVLLQKEYLIEKKKKRNILTFRRFCGVSKPYIQFYQKLSGVKRYYLTVIRKVLQ